MTRWLSSMGLVVVIVHFSFAQAGPAPQNENEVPRVITIGPMCRLARHAMISRIGRWSWLPTPPIPRTYWRVQ